MLGCYLGRGSLLVSVLGSSRGFITLTGQSEVNLIFEEDNESVLDARNGVNERVDWYVRNYRARLEAQCFDIRKDAIELLTKSTYSADAGATADYPLPNGITLGNAYLLKPNLTAVSVADALAAPVSGAHYTYDAAYGLITFSDITGFTEPLVVTATDSGHDSFALNGKNEVLVEAYFKGFSATDKRKVSAHFYRLALDITESFQLVQKGFSPLTVRLQATPDTSQPLDPQLGQYGRIMLL